MADLVVTNTLHLPQPHGQKRLGVIESMNLALLVNAEHHRLVGLVQIKTDDFPHLLHKKRIGGQLLAVRLPHSGEPWTTASGSPSG